MPPPGGWEPNGLALGRDVTRGTREEEEEEPPPGHPPGASPPAWLWERAFIGPHVPAVLRQVPVSRQS